MELQKANQRPFDYRNIISETNGKPTYSAKATAYGNVVLSGTLQYTPAGVVSTGDARIYLSIRDFKSTGLMVGSRITINDTMEYTVESVDYSLTSVRLILRRLWN